MASSITLKALAIIAFTVFLNVQAISGWKIECEDLNKDSCSFAVSSTRKRCVLEKIVKRSGCEEYTCKTSSIEAGELTNWIETDECIEACGLDRSSLGISSDSLLESRFTMKLCSHQCYDKCPNIVDLYFNLAAGEGVFLPKLCKEQGNNARRVLSEFKSSNIVAAPEASLGAPEASLVTPEAYAPSNYPFSSETAPSPSWYP